jgi:hypothetical protein
MTFTDYFFVILKVDGEWKIASKVYSAKDGLTSRPFSD